MNECVRLFLSRIGPPNYTGLRCEKGLLSSLVCKKRREFSIVEIDYCSSNPCSAHGRCLSGKFGYQCQCFEEYTGDHCEGN